MDRDLSCSDMESVIHSANSVDDTNVDSYKGLLKMNTIFKVRHKPSGRFLSGSNTTRNTNALRLTGKPPVGRIWNSYKDALAYCEWHKPLFHEGGISREDLEIVEYRLVEESTTQVR